MNKQFKMFFLFLGVLIIPALCQASTTILTNASPNHIVTSGNDERVYGTSTSNHVVIENGARAELFYFPGQNTIQIQSSSDLFSVSRSGTIVTFQGSDGTVLKMPATQTPQIINFTDLPSLTLSIYNGQVMLDGQILVNEFVGITPDESFAPKLSLECDGESIYLYWDQVEGAEAYRLEVGTDAQTDDWVDVFESSVWEEGQSPNVQIPLDIVASGETFYAVRAQKGAELSPKSNVVHFGRYSAGDHAVLATGAEVSTSAPATGEEGEVFFYPVENPSNFGDNIAAAYAFASTQELADVVATIPVSGSYDYADLKVVHTQGPAGAADPLEFIYDSNSQKVTVYLDNNWTFENIPEPLGRRRNADQTDLQLNSGNLILVLAREEALQPTVKESDIIEMPFFKQSGQTCWATAGVMLEKGLYPAEDGPIYDPTVWEWMVEMNIDIDQGLRPHRYSEYINLFDHGTMQFERFFFQDSVKAKIVELINQGLPVLFSRAGHVVLVVGYYYDVNSNLVLVQHNSDSSMYQEMSFYDSYEKSSLAEFLSMLTWSWSAPHPDRARQSLDIPSANQDHGEFFFQGRNQADENSRTGRFHLRYNEQTQGGYDWLKDNPLTDDDVFQDWADQIRYSFPVYNTDRRFTANLSFLFSLRRSYLMAQDPNALEIFEDISVGPGQIGYAEGVLDLTGLKNSLDSIEPFQIKISLYDWSTSKSIFEVFFEKITLGPFPDDVQPKPSNAIVSDFEAGAQYVDRWGIGPQTAGFASGWFTPVDVAEYKTSGGNPGGYLSWRGSQGDWWYFVTYSDKYKGDRSFALDKNLKFDLKTDNMAGSANSYIPFMIISGADVSGSPMHIFQLQSAHGEPALNWTTYSIPLNASSPWRVSSNSILSGSSEATNDDIRQVLSTLTSLRIRGEYGSSAATGGLDNVMLGAD